MTSSTTDRGFALGGREAAVMLLGAACAAATALAGNAAIMTTSASGVVDTRLVRSGDGIVAVADTRRPIVALSNHGPAETSPRGALVIIR